MKSPRAFPLNAETFLKKLRRLLKQFPKGPATPSRASGTREKIVRSMSRNRAVIGAELCGRWSRIVRSIFPLPANPSEQAPARLRLPGEKPRRKSIKKRGCIPQDTSSSFFYCKCDASNQASAGASAASSAAASSAFAAASASALAAASATFFSATF